MKTKLFIVLAGFFLFSATAIHAAVLRVNNNPNIVVPYTTLTAAYNAASPGDTIYLEGSETSYGYFAISKQIVVIGPGYFLSQNPETQSIQKSAMMGSVYLTSTSASGSQFIGLEIYELYFHNVNNIQNVEIMRNKITYLGTNSCYALNATIKQNYISSFTGSYNNSIIRNNCITGVNVYSPANTLVFFNNVITNGLTLNNVQCFNNILTGGTCTLTNTMAAYNLCSGTQFPAGNNNQQNISMSDVFVCWSNCTGYSSDGRYQLKTGSPAIGAGSNGEDCGMFGGNDPYVLSGMPAIPAIYSFQYFNNNTTINVTMSAKSHN